MIEYKKATIYDAESLAKIRVDFLSEANNINTEIEKELMYKANIQFMYDSLANGNFSSWLAIENREIVATSGISFYILPPNKKCPNGKVAYIGNMFTYPKYRKQGIASKLFILAVEESKKHGCTKLLLNATDMGRPIYEKFGFVDTHNDMVYYTL